MIVRLSVDNVVEYWDVLKFAAARTSGVEEKYVPRYLTGLLKDLMCEKIQCWINLSDSREMIAVAMTRIMLKVSGVPYLFFFCAYGFSPSSDQDKTDLIECFSKFARNTGCVSIVGMSDNPMAINVMKKIGMKEYCKIFEMEVK